MNKVSVNDHLNGLKENFELLAKEIDSLRQERDLYKAEGITICFIVNTFCSAGTVTARTHELKSIRRNKVCLLCREELLGTHLATETQIIPGKCIVSRPVGSPPGHIAEQQPPKSLVDDLSTRSSVVASRIPLYRPIGTQSRPAASRNSTPVTAKLSFRKLSSPDDISVVFPSRKVSPRSPPQSDSAAASHTLDSSEPSHSVTVPRSPDIVQPSRSSGSLSSIFPPIIADIGHKKLEWSVEFNHNVHKELSVGVAQTLLHTHGVYCIKFSADGRYLAVASQAKVSIYDVTTGSLAS
jgi:hypothetical protein